MVDLKKGDFYLAVIINTSRFENDPNYLAGIVNSTDVFKFRYFKLHMCVGVMEEFAPVLFFSWNKPMIFKGGGCCGQHIVEGLKDDDIYLHKPWPIGSKKWQKLYDWISAISLVEWIEYKNNPLFTEEEWIQTQNRIESSSLENLQKLVDGIKDKFCK